MSKTIIGQANHIHSDGGTRVLEIAVIDPETSHDIPPFVTIRANDDCIIINSVEQFKQIEAFVLKAFEEMSDE